MIKEKRHIVLTLLSLLIICTSCVSKEKFKNTDTFLISDYKKIGDAGPTLLLIPCMSCRWNEWETFMEQNKDKYRMYAITVPGFGGTPVPDLPLNVDNKTPWRDNLLKALSNFIDKHELKNITVVGHSWGSQIALQIAVLRPDVVIGLINVDGSIESKSWIPKDEEGNARALAQADSSNLALANSAEEWRTFNSVSYRYHSRTDSIPVSDVDFALKLHGSFMATPKHVLHQYWRENLFVDLDEYLHKLDPSIRILDIQSLVARDGNYEKLQEDYLKTMQDVDAPDHIQYVFMNKTYHFIMQHRPQALNEIIEKFMAGEEIDTVYDF